MWDQKKKNFFDIHIREEDFQRIKVQLRALGLITTDERRTPGKETYWTLTPYGDNVMTQVAAVRSSRATQTT
jgi:hypothetical protein